MVRISDPQKKKQFNDFLIIDDFFIKKVTFFKAIEKKFLLKNDRFKDDISLF